MRAIAHGPIQAALAFWILLQPIRSYADPQRPPPTRNTQNEIRFGLLTKSDFLAGHPPLELGRHSADLNAVSCLRIACYGVRIEFSERGVGRSDAAITASVHMPRFVAIFERNCSWWSPQPEDAAYALAHEQIHFAIAEYEARKLTQEMRTKGRTVRGRGRTRDEAVANVELNLQGLASNAQLAAGREHDAFDSATLRDRSPSVAQEWVDRYEKRLGIDFSIRAK